MVTLRGRAIPLVSLLTIGQFMKYLDALASGYPGHRSMPKHVEPYELVSTTLQTSIRKQPGQSETDLDFSSQAFSIFLMTDHYPIQGWLTFTDIYLFFRLGPHYLKMIIF